MRTSNRLRIWGFGAALLLIATCGAYLMGRLAARTLLLPAVLSRHEVGQAPDLVGRELESARREAEGGPGGLDVLGVAYATEVDSGKVLFQYPPEGLPLEAGKPIEVIVSAGPGRRRMPDLAGLPEKAALELLERAGAKGARVVAVDASGSERGTVALTRPEAGAPLAEGDSVVVGVSRGGDVIEVPNLTGKTAEEAALILQGAQLRVGTTDLAPDEESAGRLVVVGQDPPAGGLATSGSPVNLRLGPSAQGGAE